jgi:hypothetical protein
MKFPVANMVMVLKRGGKLGKEQPKWSQNRERNDVD